MHLRAQAVCPRLLTPCRFLSCKTSKIKEGFRWGGAAVRGFLRTVDNSMFSPIVLSHLDRFGEFDSTVATILVYMRVFCWFCTTKNELGYRLISASPGSLIKTIIKRFLAKLKHAKGHVIWRSRVDKTQPKERMRWKGVERWQKRFQITPHSPPRK